MTRGFVFDMDDTLYYERDYVRSGFRSVAHAVAEAGEADDVERWLWSAFEDGRRHDTFDGLLEAFPTLAARHAVPALIDAYRAHRPAIDLAPGIEQLLDRLKERDVPLAVLSDGPLASQAAKAAALHLDRWFDPVVLTAALGEGAEKPSTRGFELIATTWGLPHDRLAYVADNPAKDFAAPRRLGWLGIRLRRTGQLHAASEPAGDAWAPDVVLDDPAEILAWIGDPRPGAEPVRIDHGEPTR